MKGQIDIIFGMTIFVGLVIAMLIVTQVFVNGIYKNTDFQKNIAQNNPASNAIVTHAIGTFNIINNFLVFLYIFIGVASILAAAFTESAPVLAVISFIMLPIEIYISFVYHDVFFNIVQTSSLSTVANSYPALLIVFQYFPLIAFIISLILIVVSFGKG